MSLFTIPRPIPLDPPVTIATLGLPESASCTRPSDEADPDVMIVFSLVFRRLALNCRPSAGRVAVWLRRKHRPDRRFLCRHCDLALHYRAHVFCYRGP